MITECGPNGGHFDNAPGVIGYKNKTGLSYNSGLYGFTQKSSCPTITYWDNEIYFWTSSNSATFKYNILDGTMKEVTLPIVFSRIGTNVITSIGDPITFFASDYDNRFQMLNSQTQTLTNTEKARNSISSAVCNKVVNGKIYSFLMTSYNGVEVSTYDTVANIMVTKNVPVPPEADLVIHWAHYLGDNKFLLMHRGSSASSSVKGTFVTSIYDDIENKVTLECPKREVEYIFPTLPGIRNDEFQTVPCNITYQQGNYIYAFAKTITGNSVNISGAGASWFRYDIINKKYEIVHTIFNGPTSHTYATCYSDYGIFSNPMYSICSYLSVTTFD